MWKLLLMILLIFFVILLLCLKKYFVYNLNEWPIILIQIVCIFLNISYICLKVDELVKKKGIPITTYNFPSQKGLRAIFFESYKNVMSQFNTPVSITLDKLWHWARLFSSATKPRPNWNGFLQDISTGHHQPKSKHHAFSYIICHRTIEEVKCEGAFYYIWSATLF